MEIANASGSCWLVPAVLSWRLITISVNPSSRRTFSGTTSCPLVVKVSLRNLITSSFQMNLYSVLVVQKNVGFLVLLVGIRIRNRDPLSTYVQETLETDGMKFISETCSVSLHNDMSSFCDVSSDKLDMSKVSKLTA